MKRISAPLVLALALAVPLIAHAQLLQPMQPLDRIVAVVNDGVVLQSELDAALAQVRQQFAQNPQALPPTPVLERQVLERLILMKLQVQRAEENGIRASDQEIDAALQTIAQNNHIDIAQLRQSLAQQGIDYAAFRKQIAEQLMVQKLRDNVIQGDVHVTDAEVNNLINSPLFKAGEVNIAQILIAVPEGASPDQVSAAKAKADEVEKQIVGGMNFKAAAIRYSQAPNALDGGVVGWRRVDELPPALADLAVKMQPGQVTPPLRAPEGFYILKLEGKRPAPPVIVTEFHARDLLIRTSPTLDSTQAQAKIDALRKQIVDGKAQFADLARKDSQDESTANDGGNMGWFQPQQWGSVVAAALPKLKDNEISAPLQVPEGWLLIQRLGERKVDRTEQVQRDQARMAIGNRKAEDAYNNFLRDLRSTAYVRILLPGAEADAKQAG